jgi:tetratricopeptide (TPR) repeat protein
MKPVPPLAVFAAALFFLAGPSPASGQTLKVMVSEATYVMGDADTLAGAEEAALLRAKRKAVEQAGVYVESFSQDVETQVDGTSSHLNELSVRTIAAAVTETEILEKKRTFENDRVVFYVRIRATVHVDMLAEAVKRMKSDEQLAAHHRQLQTENSQLKSELQHLKKQLQTTNASPREVQAGLRNRRAAVNLGRAAMQSHNLREKIDLATQAMAADDRYVDAYIIRGQTYLRIASLDFAKKASKADLNGYVEQAIEDFGRALELEPTSAWALLGRGDAYTWQRKMEEAARDYRQVLKLDPYFDVARQRLIALQTTTAKKQYAAKRWQQALATLDQILQPDLPPSWLAQQKDALVLRSQIYARMGELDRAVEDLGKVLKVNPANPAVLLERAQLYRQLMQGRLAKDDFEQACALGSAEACRSLQ